MNKKRNPSEIGAAIGYISNFFGPLNQALIEAGGNPEMLYFARADHAKPLMELLAKTIVESGLWKVPKSLIIQEIREATMEEGPEYLDGNLKRLWEAYSPAAKWLTTVRLSDEIAPKYFTGTIPDELEEIVEGGKHQCGDIIEWEGRSWIITYIYYPDIRYLFLAPAEWIDLEN